MRSSLSRYAVLPLLLSCLLAWHGGAVAPDRAQHSARCACLSCGSDGCCCLDAETPAEALGAALTCSGRAQPPAAAQPVPPRLVALPPSPLPHPPAFAPAWSAPPPPAPRFRPRAPRPAPPRPSLPV